MAATISLRRAAKCADDGPDTAAGATPDGRRRNNALARKSLRATRMLQTKPTLNAIPSGCAPARLRR